MVDNLTPQQRRKNMSGIRSRNTNPEKLVRSLIHRLGYRFKLHDKRLPGKPDIVLPRHRKIVLVHGCFWHMHNCKRGRVFPKTNEPYWVAKREGNVQRDRANQHTYELAGWKTLIVWECETKKPDALRQKLRKFLVWRWQIRGMPIMWLTSRLTSCWLSAWGRRTRLGSRNADKYWAKATENW